MLKHYLTDGLVQIAIVLSLLRTDLNNYLNVNYVNYPEVQEILQGQTAAYTQTNFHLLQDVNLGTREIYRKSVDTEQIFRSALFRDLRTFQPNFDLINQIRIPTYLLVAESSNFRPHEATEPNDNENDDENNNSLSYESQSEAIDTLQEEGEQLLSTLEENLNGLAQNLVPLLQGIPQGTEPTREV